MTITPTKINYGTFNKISYLYKNYNMKKEITRGITLRSDKPFEDEIEYTLEGLKEINSNGTSGINLNYDDVSIYNEIEDVYSLNVIIDVLDELDIKYDLQFFDNESEPVKIEDAVEGHTDWKITMN